MRLLLFITALLLTIPSTAYGTEACEASNIIELRVCANKVIAKQITEIVITADITITEENYDHFNLSRAENFIIRGDVPTRKITRTWARPNGDYYATTGEHHTRDALFALSLSSNVVIKDLVLDEKNCVNCSNMLDLYHANDIHIDNVDFIGAHRFAASINGASNIVIENSLILETKVFGLWIGGGLSKNIIIKNNKIKDSNSNGVFIHHVDGVKIRNNIFDNNHNLALWGHQGGQIDIARPAKNVYIQSNLIINGTTLSNNQKAAGIEFAGREGGYQMSQIYVERNLIHNNKGHGIYVNPNFEYDIDNIFFRGNTIYNSGGDNLKYYTRSFAQMPEVQVSNNCLSSNCADPRIRETDNLFPDNGDPILKLTLNRSGMGGSNGDIVWALGNNFHEDMKLSVASACDPSIQYHDVVIDRWGPSANFPGQDSFAAVLTDFFADLTAKGTKLKVTLSDDYSQSEIIVDGTCSLPEPPPVPTPTPNPTSPSIALNRTGLGGANGDIVWALGNNFHKDMTVSIASACDPSIKYENLKLDRVGPDAQFPDQDSFAAVLTDFFAHLTSKGTKLKVTISDSDQSESLIIDGTCSVPEPTPEPTPEPEPTPTPTPEPPPISAPTLDRSGFRGRRGKTVWVYGKNLSRNMNVTVASACNASIQYNNIQASVVKLSTSPGGQDYFEVRLHNFFSNITRNGKKLKVTVSVDGQEDSLITSGSCR